MKELLGYERRWDSGPPYSTFALQVRADRGTMKDGHHYHGYYRDDRY